MKILIDTNIIYTFITEREDRYLNDAKLIVDKCINKEIEGAVAFHSLSNLWYLMRHDSFEIRLRWMKFVCRSFNVANADNPLLLKALENTAFHDFEDNLQDCCAQSVGADYIVTANVRDYEGHSSVKAVTPSELLSILNATDDSYIAPDTALEVREQLVEYNATQNVIPVRPHLHIAISYPTAC